jgi:hypothetical protein
MPIGATDRPSLVPTTRPPASGNECGCGRARADGRGTIVERYSQTPPPSSHRSATPGPRVGSCFVEAGAADLTFQTPASDDTRARRPGACRRPQPRAKAGANGARARTSLDRPERGPAGPPGGTSIRACAPVRGRRAADARRHAIGLLSIGVPPEAPWSSSTSSRHPSSPARRPDRLAHRLATSRSRCSQRSSVMRAPCPAQRRPPSQASG